MDVFSAGKQVDGRRSVGVGVGVGTGSMLHLQHIYIPLGGNGDRVTMVTHTCVTRYVFLLLVDKSSFVTVFTTTDTYACTLDSKEFFLPVVFKILPTSGCSCK